MNTYLEKLIRTYTLEIYVEECKVQAKEWIENRDALIGE